MNNYEEIIIYQTEDDLTKINVNMQNETVWLSLEQIANLFQRDKSTISRHIKNIFADGELPRESTVAKFATVQNEGDIYHRADAEKDFMGLSTFSGEQPTLREAKIAKNYLDEKELRAMGQLVSGYLDFAERQAEREVAMTMEDWVKHLDGILTSTGENLLIGNGTVSHLQAMDKAQTEYKKYKAKTLSGVEKDYLDTIKLLEEKSKK